MQSVFDELYKNSLAKCEFKNLISIITTEENIRLAYRNLKKNAGSKTPGTDGKTIADLAKMSEPELIGLVQQKFKWYQPQSVRRKEIPKGNGKTRPLGIPTIMDRLIQQCALQVMEPICEAKFCETSNGFRPNRGVENALAQAEKHMQKSNLHIVIDIDIKGFFDNVNHGKLLRQIWAMGIHDKKLLSIISAMLKAEVAGIGFPEKGTPQGGIISPLLSNIVLNELDWWITSQWVGIPTRHEYSGKIHANGTKDQSKKYRELRKTKLKECYIVRYADDFKIFCRKHSDAVKLFEATRAWLKERLGLDISPEKSRIVNLKHEYSDFLGFRIKVHKGKDNKYVVISHIAPKALDRIKDTAKEKVKAIQHSSGEMEEFKVVNDYNSFVMGIHNYYRMATAASPDIQRLAFEIKIAIKNRLQERVKRRSDQPIPEYAKRYAKSKEVRFIGKNILLPIGYIQHHPPIHKKKSVNKYTAADELHNKAEALAAGYISEVTYIEECLWISLEAMIKLLACTATLYGDQRVTDLTQALASYAFEYGRLMLYSRELEIVNQFIESQYQLDAELEQKYSAYLEDLQKESEKFCMLIDNAFVPNFRDAFLHSVLLAKAAGVKKEEILSTTEDIDSFFLD